MPLTPPKKRTYWISIIFFIIGLVFFVIGLVDLLGYLALTVLAGLGLWWFIFTWLFTFLGWFMLFGGVSWKGF